MFKVNPGIQVSELLRDPAKFLGREVDFKGVLFRIKDPALRHA